MGQDAENQNNVIAPSERSAESGMTEELSKNPNDRNGGKQVVPVKNGKKWIPWVVVGVVIVLLVIGLFVMTLVAGGLFAYLKVKNREISPIPQTDVSTTLPNEDLFPDDLSGVDDGSDEMQTGGNTDDAGTSVTEDYTIIVYMVGTDLESANVNGTLSACAASDLLEMAQCTYGENVNLLVQSGGCSNWAYEFMKDGEVQRFQILSNGDMQEKESLGSISMVESSTLSDYLNWAAKNYPAKHYGLIFWDHGGGIPVSFGCDEIYAGDMLSPSEISAGIAGSGLHFDFIGFDACLTGTLEMACALSQHADYLIGSETLEPGNGWDYSDWLTEVGKNPEMATTEIAIKIVNDYNAFYQKNQYPDGINLSVIDLSKIQNVKTQYESYMTVWGQYISEGFYSSLFTARSNSAEFPSSDSIDLYSLADQMAIDYAAELKAAVADAVFYTNGNMPYAHGIASYFPLGYPSVYATDVRSELKTIGFSDQTIACLDSYISLYANFCTASGVNYDFSSITGASWYDSAVVAQYNTTGSQSLSAAGYQNNDYMLKTEVVGNSLVIPATADDWKIIQRIETQLFYQIDNKLYLMGSDDIHWLDEQGNIKADYPEFWLAVDMQTVAYDALVAYKDKQTDEWYTYGQVYATLNGNYSQLIGIIVYWSNDVEDGKILGFYNVDNKTLQSDGIMHNLNAEDTVEFIYPYYDANAQSVQFQILGGVHQVNGKKFIPVYGPTSNFENLVSGTVGYSSICVTDVNGQQYMTDMLPE